MVVNTLKAMQSDEAFELFWKYVTDMAMSLEVEDPVLPRKIKTPNRLLMLPVWVQRLSIFPVPQLSLLSTVF